MTAEVGLDQQGRGAAEIALPAEGHDVGPAPDRRRIVAGLHVHARLQAPAGVVGHLGADAAVIGPVQQLHGGAMVDERGLRAAELLLDIADVLFRQKHPGRRARGDPHGVEAGLSALQVAVGVAEAEVAPGALARRPRGGEPGEHLLGLLTPVLAAQIDAVAIGLGLAVDGFGRLLRQAVEIRLSGLHGLAFRPLGPDGKADPGGRAQQLARDPGLMAQPLAQVAVHLADGDPGVGDLQLDVVAPVVGDGAGRALGVGLRLHAGQLVQELGGHDLAGHPVLGHVRRNREGLDNQAVVLARLPDQHAQRHRRGRADHQAQGLQHQRHPVLPAAHAQMSQLQVPLLMQVLGLQVDQPPLVAQEGGGLRVHCLAGAARGAAEGDGHRLGIGLFEGLRRPGLRQFGVFSHVRRSGRCGRGTRPAPRHRPR